MDRKKFLLSLEQKNNEWKLIQRLRGTSFDLNDVVCFCYKDFYLKIKLEVTEYHQGRFWLKIWEQDDDEEKRALHLDFWMGDQKFPRWQRIFLVRPASTKKCKPVIRRYAKTK